MTLDSAVQAIVAWMDTGDNSVGTVFLAFIGVYAVLWTWDRIRPLLRR